MKNLRNLFLLLVFTFVLYTPSGTTSGEDPPPPIQVYLPLVIKPCAKPILISPENGAQLDTLIPTFNFEIPASSRQISIALQIAQLADFSSVMTGYSSGGLFGWQMFANLSPAVDYRWRIKADCGDGLVTYSDIWNFTSGSGEEILPAPTLTSPTDGSTTTSTTVVFDWQDLPGAVTYYFFYGEVGSSWSVMPVAFSTATRSLLNGKTYNWYVVAANDYATGNPSPHWTFTTPNP